MSKPTTPKQDLGAAEVITDTPNGIQPGSTVWLADGRKTTTVAKAKDTHVPAWYVKGVRGPVPENTLSLEAPGDAA